MQYESNVKALRDCDPGHFKLEKYSGSNASRSAGITWSTESKVFFEH